MQRLLTTAVEYGVTVRVATITPTLRGFFDPGTSTVYLSRRLTDAEARSTLAHELGHVHYGHDCTTPRTEAQANSYACRLLIDSDAYAKAERIAPHVDHLAEELGVTTEMVRHYQQYALQKLGSRTYARAQVRRRA